MIEPPAKRQSLTQSGVYTERGQPVMGPHGSASRKARLSHGGDRRREQAKASLSSGGSGRGVDPRALCERGLTSRWSCITRAPEKAIEESKQRTAVTTAGALSHAAVEWHALNWPHVHRNVR